jgi:eukaryotic-like serine/threonine-protein kinase
MNIENGTIINQYKIISAIGKGGMGEVFLGQDTKLDRKVALKILPSEFAEDADRMSRFVREAKSASALNHPNIITIHEIGESDRIHFIATEFIDGKTLNAYKQANPLNYKSALEIAIQVASALDEAHSAGIVHRDIKPDNVMIRANGLVKILDFGIAKLTNRHGDAETRGHGEEDKTLIAASHKTSPGMIIGTPNYMSPEQAKGKVVDARTDIFSFGVVLYEMIAGGLPFEGENALEMIGAILHKEAKPLNENVPTEITKIINKCLRKDRDERYQIVNDVLIDLKDVKQDLEFSVRVTPSAVKPLDIQATQILKSGTTSEKITPQGVTLTKTRYFAAGLLTLLLAVGGFFGYKYLSPTKQIESIAVMPFVNESGNADVEYLSDGMTETLIKSLSNLPNLNVKPRSTVFRYKGKDTDMKIIGKELNVEAILNGRVIQRGEQLTLSLELIDVQNDKVLWTESYQRKQSDLVSLQSEIAKDVSTKLKSKLSGAEEAKVTKTSTANPEAYQAYLKGRYYWNRRTAENIKKAIEQFKAATDLDPNYALAYAGLADCYVVLPQYAGTPLSETLPRAKAFAERAISIDDQLGEPHATLGNVSRQSWQWAESEQEYKRAIELSPNYATAYHWYANLLEDIGRYDEAALMIRRAHDIDPLSSVISMNISIIYQIQNNHKAVIENSREVIALDPNFPAAYQYLGLSVLKEGRQAEAISNFEKAVELSDRASDALLFLGYGYGVTRKRSEAIAIAKELEGKYAKKESSAQSIAAVYAGLGDKDKAFEWLEKEFQAKGYLANIRWDIPYESLRDDPRYKDLLKRMGLPE